MHDRAEEIDDLDARLVDVARRAALRAAEGGARRSGARAGPSSGGPPSSGRPCRSITRPSSSGPTGTLSGSPSGFDRIAALQPPRRFHRDHASRRRILVPVRPPPSPAACPRDGRSHRNRSAGSTPSKWISTTVPRIEVTLPRALDLGRHIESPRSARAPRVKPTTTSSTSCVEVSRRIAAASRRVALDALFQPGARRFRRHEALAVLRGERLEQRLVDRRVQVLPNHHGCRWLGIAVGRGRERRQSGRHRHRKHGVCARACTRPRPRSAPPRARGPRARPPWRSEHERVDERQQEGGEPGRTGGRRLDDVRRRRPPWRGSATARCPRQKRGPASDLGPERDRLARRAGPRSRRPARDPPSPERSHVGPLAAAADRGVEHAEEVLAPRLDRRARPRAAPGRPKVLRRQRAHRAHGLFEGARGCGDAAASTRRDSRLVSVGGRIVGALGSRPQVRRDLAHPLDPTVSGSSPRSSCETRSALPTERAPPDSRRRAAPSRDPVRRASPRSPRAPPAPAPRFRAARVAAAAAARAAAARARSPARRPASSSSPTRESDSSSSKRECRIAEVPRGEAHRLRLRRAADPRHAPPDVHGRSFVAREARTVEVDLSVGDRDDVGRNVGGDVALGGLDERQRRHRAPPAASLLAAARSSSSAWMKKTSPGNASRPGGRFISRLSSRYASACLVRSS